MNLSQPYVITKSKTSHVIHKNEERPMFQMLKPKSPENASLEFLLAHSVVNRVND